MDDEILNGTLDAITEDFTLQQLADDSYMLTKLKGLLGLELPFLRIFIEAARDIKALRGDIPSPWIPYLWLH